MSTFRHQHTRMRDGTQSFRIDLPYGAGYVEISADTHIKTGNPMFKVEVVSDSLDKPAEDGRLYEQEVDSAYDTIYLIGYPDPEGQN